MEGINTLCLGVFLCVIAVAVGVIIFGLLQIGAKTIVQKKYGEKKQWLGVAIASVIAIVVSCALFYTAYAPAFPGYHTPQRRPNPEDIIGIWTPTADTLQRMEAAGYPVSTHTLEFHEDGSFIMTNMPDVIFWRRKGEFYSGLGKWSVEKDFQGFWQVIVVFSSLTPPYYPDPPLSGPTPCAGQSVPCDGLEFSLDMWNRRPPYTLYVNIGIELDPDFYFHRNGDVHD
jgi:hypothetical protein